MCLAVFCWFLEFVWRNDVKHEAQDGGMKAGHKDKTNRTSDEASKLDLFIIIEATGEIVSDLFVKAGNEDAGDHDDDPRNAPTELKFPIHKLIVLYL